MTSSPTCTSPRGSRCVTAPSTPEALVERAAAARPAGPRAHRPRRPLRRGPVRPGRDRGRHRPRPRRRPRRRCRSAAHCRRRDRPRCRRPRPRRAPRSAAAPSATPATRGSPSSPGGAQPGCRPGVGWAALCRLVTETHLRGERGVPVTLRARGRWCRVRRPDPTSCVCGRVLAPGPEGRQSRVEREPEPAAWCCSGPTPTWAGRCWPGAPTGRASLLGGLAAPAATATRVVIEVVCHGGPEGTPASPRPRPAGCSASPTSRASRRCSPRRCATSTRGSRAVVDVLDAARRLVALDTRHLDRVTDAAHLASTDDDARRRPRGHRWRPRPRRRAGRARPWPSGSACAQSARHDLGIGSVHLPEPERAGHRARASSAAGRCSSSAAAPRSAERYPGASERELMAVAEPARPTSSRSSPSSATRPTSSPSPRSST